MGGRVDTDGVDGYLTTRMASSNPCERRGREGGMGGIIFLNRMCKYTEAYMMNETSTDPRNLCSSHARFGHYTATYG